MQPAVCGKPVSSAKEGRTADLQSVVDGNDRAIRLYEKLGFQHVGRIPGGFLLKTGVYQDIFVYYHTLSAAEGI